VPSDSDSEAALAYPVRAPGIHGKIVCVHLPAPHSSTSDISGICGSDVMALHSPLQHRVLRERLTGVALVGYDTIFVRTNPIGEGMVSFGHCTVNFAFSLSTKASKYQCPGAWYAHAV